MGQLLRRFSLGGNKGPAPPEKKNLNLGAWKCNFQNFGHQKERL